MKAQPWLVHYMIPGLFLVIACGGYLLASQAKAGVGYPLDDAWIHQTYARNFGEVGEWTFNRGQPSGGSTAPGWTFWLAIGYWLRFNSCYWTLFSGILALAGLAWIGNRIAQQAFLEPIGFPWVGVFLLGEWHLVWSALSGMETLLFAGVVLGIFYLIGKDQNGSILVGCLIGLSCWLRPDGITLLGPAVLVAIMSKEATYIKVKCLLRIGGGFLLVFLPYLIFNLVVAGEIWPNTFYAKQAEYSILQQTPLFDRILSLLSLPMVGAGVILFPGFVWACVKFVKNRCWWGLSAVIWWFGFTILYAWRLPVTYQHGRYLIPSMPVFWVIGLMGLVDLFYSLGFKPYFNRLIKFGTTVLLVLVWLVFLVLGGRSYAEDVAIINTEMVATAHWVADNLPEKAVIGAHDIGALGYFGQRKIIDLAGLISPEVILFIRDEERLLEYLYRQKADVLVTFPGWYPEMVEDLTRIYQSKGQFSPQAGGENMHVFALQK